MGEKDKDEGGGGWIEDGKEILVGDDEDEEEKEEGALKGDEDEGLVGVGPAVLAGTVVGIGATEDGEVVVVVGIVIVAKGRGGAELLVCSAARDMK